MTVKLFRSMTNLRPSRSWPAFLQVVRSSGTQGPTRVPSTIKVRCDGVSAMEILNMCCNKPGQCNMIAKPRLPWHAKQTIESIEEQEAGDRMCRKLLKSESTIVKNGDGQRTLQWRSTGGSQSRNIMPHGPCAGTDARS